MPIIKFLNIARDSSKVSKYSRAVLLDLMQQTGVSSVTITSTARTPYDQARIMYENIERHGVAHQKRLYGRFGDKIIDEYVSLSNKGVSKTNVISGMKAKITQVGPRNVSRHAGDPTKINVIDIAPSSIPINLHANFSKAIDSEARIDKFFKPPKDPAFHIEISQPNP